MGPVTTTPRTRRSKEDIRSMLLEAAQAMLREEGLGVGTDALTFKRVFDRVERDTGMRLTNASVIKRVWENQADYQTDVLLGIAADEDHAEMDRTFAALVPALETLDVSTPEARRAALRELCRIGGNANINALAESDNWSLWFSVWSQASVGEITDQKKALQVALLRGYETVTDMYEETYQALLDLLGFRIRPGMTMRQFTVSVGALAEGCTLRNRVDGDMGGLFLPTGPDGEDQEWTLFAVGAEALALRFFELDPDWTPPAP
jgi:hypothetical protein